MATALVSEISQYEINRLCWKKIRLWQVAFWMFFPEQAWHLHYSHQWHQYLASTPRSSLWSSTCFLEQGAMFPQVRPVPTSLLLNSSERWWVVFYYMHASWIQCLVLYPSIIEDTSSLRYLCCGESDDRLCGGAAGSNSSGDEHQFVWGSRLWGPEDWCGLGCSTSLRNCYGETKAQRLLFDQKYTS